MSAIGILIFLTAVGVALLVGYIANDFVGKLKAGEHEPVKGKNDRGR
ncbi:hypothetical protein JIR001_09090 [Polycladomyces abyssicola]|jgi:hypothetical protein|uniref:Uncharacterized protein n=1 Tax=Polycladomyces abyssicola TaxID=1125966 RepID=A0A8D5UEQ7_9BACL|nr:hypothetical protein [Polycladomyces abyssicola]BCU81126.1 hypothetical protein JIR001_09090 [Polycladomyces abyssicola]